MILRFRCILNNKMDQTDFKILSDIERIDAFTIDNNLKIYNIGVYFDRREGLALESDYPYICELDLNNVNKYKCDGYYGEGRYDSMMNALLIDVYLGKFLTKLN